MAEVALKLVPGPRARPNPRPAHGVPGEEQRGCRGLAASNRSPRWELLRCQASPLPVRMRPNPVPSRTDVSRMVSDGEVGLRDDR